MHQQHLICFPLTCWERNNKSMCLPGQTELGGCVLNGWAPGVLNNDSQSPLLLGMGSQHRGTLNWKNFCPNNGLCCLRRAPWTSVISPLHCFWTIGTNLPSAWGSLCCAGREALCNYQWRVHLGSHQWTETNREDNALYLGSALVNFSGMTVYQAILRK